MSLPELRGAGKLVTDPRSGETKTGGRWTNGLVRFQAWRRNGDDWEPGDAVTASVIAFDEVADLLAGYARGDDIAVQGTTSVAIWKDQAQLKITLARVWTPEKRKSGAVSGDVTGNATATASVGAEPTQAQRHERSAQSPTDLDQYRREAGNRLLRQHAGNAQRAGRLA